MYIGIGSNVEPERNLKACSALLRKEWPSIRFSSVYRTAAQEVTDQDDFLNAVACIETDQSPEEVLDTLQTIEHHLKKDPPYRYGPRTIDLDILLYDNLITPNITEWRTYKLIANSYKLLIPHHEMENRRFVVEPLCDLVDPEEAHPVSGTTWKELLENVRDQKCTPTKIVLAD